LSFFLPIYLTLGALPFIYLFSVFVTYQSVLTNLSWRGDNHGATRHAKVALMLGFRLHLRDMNAFRAKNRAWDFARTKSVREGLGMIAEHRRSLRAAERAERRAADRLREYAGVPGTDKEGRQLDQREFAETKNALDHIASAQIGWYRNRGEGYRPEMLEIQKDFLGSYGLPPDHGIQLFVSKNRRAWYAWRRTTSGWCFAIGAAKPPYDRWIYDGPEPPKGFPGKDWSWGRVPLERTMNWEPE
jgi:hypothetical protein